MSYILFSKTVARVSPIHEEENERCFNYLLIYDCPTFTLCVNVLNDNNVRTEGIQITLIYNVFYISCCFPAMTARQQLVYFSNGTLGKNQKNTGNIVNEINDLIFRSWKYTYIVIRSFEEKLSNVNAIPVSPEVPPGEAKYGQIVRSRINMR